jgi:microcystin-dependent protein
MAKFNTGQSFADGDTVTGAKLNNITSQLNIYTGVISEQTAMSATVSTADQLLIADTDNGDSGSANRITVQKLFSDSLTNGTYATVNLTGTITSNRTVATSATITTGTIPNLTAGTTTSTAATITNATITNGTITTALIPTLTAGTTTGTAGIFTSGTITTLNSTTGTIGNLSTTLAGDFTISQGTGTLGTSGVTAGTYGTNTAIPIISVNAKGIITTVSTTSVSGTATGSIIAWTTGIAPSGYLHCDGSAIDRTVYATLFGILSTTYGTGNGSTTFNIPDYRGQFLRGFANGQATDPDRLTRTNRGDGTTGDAVGTKQLDAFESHTHLGSVYSYYIGANGSYGSVSGVNQATATGASGGNETRPTNISVMWCIKF